ncbi:acetylornithine deacetylase [Roseinatronobacter alkalisoli]|uniref:Acetylornithine deacetylase n=1 Tax=Roseinatronobacter alkalisoli TaxID=3028235 RepID=A0ABT5TCA3_9RHOB|nr:acetylornithine deacetylase [Roseinatronobacter sp. HJB301]MDD7971553.1 acetylornithine deacetylase [Roseinatronobacter sp. HJB301]
MTQTDTTDRLTRCKEILANLIAFPSVSADGNRAVTDYLADMLTQAGARVEVMPDATGLQANLFASIGPDTDDGIILSGHTDVVPVVDQPWTHDPFAMTEADGRLYGRGTCDMKGFVAACVAMAPEFAARDLTCPVHFAFTHDEETGCFGAQRLTALLRERNFRAMGAIIGEPSLMQVIDGHKGCYEYTTHVTGLEGHGSAPDLGVNAVDFAARIVLKLVELRDVLKTRAPADCPFDPPHSTINVGALRGGHVHNIIAGTARIDWEMRPVQQSDADFVKAELAAFVDILRNQMQATYPAADIRTDIVGEVVGLIPEPVNPARTLAMALTGANGAGLVPFGTEAGLFQSIGIPSVICGPGSIAQAHKPDEYIDVSELGRCLEMLGRLADQLEQR